MKKDVTLALNYALTKGFQIHPDALKILEDIDASHLQHIIKDVVREKTKQKTFLIDQDDLESFLGIKDDESLQNEHKILFDPTPRVTSAEGVDGFNALFASRFSKLKKIVSTRPEAKLLKSISSVIATKSNSDMYVCGLVSNRSSERNITKLVVDDQSGSIEAMVFDKDLQKIADSLLIDQFVMLRVVVGKSGGFIAKDIITPDISDRASNRSESETYAVFLSDLHIGSRYFMEDELNEFVSWLSSPDPVARKIRFILIAGDVVDGVGIYPNQ
ncbi:MAG: OB-fold nucleic acid binding domain-containing protein, partial [Nitrosopumilaceae archaeon]